MSREEVSALRTLARLRGVQTSYEDVSGRRHHASTESLVAVLLAMGEPLSRVSEAPAALRHALEASARDLIPPVAVHWLGGTTVVPLSAAARRNVPAKGIDCNLTLEDGRVRSWVSKPVRGSKAGVALPDDLPVGRHHLMIKAGRVQGECWVLAASSRVGTTHLNPGRARDLGVFMPLYALRTARAWGTADLTDLGDLARWASERDAPIVGTLPMLAGYFEEPFDPSPYAPISRLFFSEIYLDPTASPDLALSTDARLLLGSEAFRREVAEIGLAGLVDYRRSAAAKRRILEPMAKAAFASPHRRREIDRFAREHPEAAEFAAFRAAVDRAGSTWQSWAGPARLGELRRSRDYDLGTARYHLYCQLLLREQLCSLGDSLRADGAVLYLDLPIGVHAGGYDVWRFREGFAQDMSVGAPPDPLATHGQDWGFPPPHPHRTRADGHDYFARCLRAHLAHARLLRIDHVMALHRLFWVPRGLGAEHGVYVNYPHEELYATLSIEAHRASEGAEGGVRIVGENLGTVPPAVNRTMAKRHVLGMSIAQFSFRAAKVPIPEPGAKTLAALNTHDTPTFAAFYSGLDLRLRSELGLADDRSPAREEAGRARLRAALDRFATRSMSVAPTEAPGALTDPAAAALRAILRRLAASPAAIVQINLEDLWLETQPQNIPGTIDPLFPNWRRKAAYALEEFDAIPGLRDLLGDLASLRLTPLPMIAQQPARAAGRGAGARGKAARSPSTAPPTTPRQARRSAPRKGQ